MRNAASLKTSTGPGSTGNAILEEDSRQLDGSSEIEGPSSVATGGIVYETNVLHVDYACRHTGYERAV